MLRGNLLLLAAVIVGVGATELPAQDAHEEIARRVLDRVPLIDGHNDLAWEIRQNEETPRDVAAYDLRAHTPGHTDIPRLREGMVGGQFWSIYVPYEAVEEGAAARYQLEQFDIAHRMIAMYPDVLQPAYSASDIERAFGAGRIASLLGMEGGHVIENSLGVLRAYYQAGARYMTLTHSRTIDWADSATDTALHGGLTRFGVEVVHEMNRMGMLVDLSHVSVETMHDVLDVAEAPVIFSHSSARALVDHPRNVPDDVLRRLPENGGVVMVTFVEPFVNDASKEWYDLPPEEREKREQPRATLSDVADHIEHVREVAGIEHVGIGSDFDGISRGPAGLEDVSKFPALFAELSRRGWNEDELAMLAGENVLRVIREAEAVARVLSRQRPPSTATIEELDGLGVAGEHSAQGR
jgi:membrane dipeptidase